MVRTPRETPSSPRHPPHLHPTTESTTPLRAAPSTGRGAEVPTSRLEYRAKLALVKQSPVCPAANPRVTHRKAPAPELPKVHIRGTALLGHLVADDPSTPRGFPRGHPQFPWRRRDDGGSKNEGWVEGPPQSSLVYS